jgi:hypothetical protein
MPKPRSQTISLTRTLGSGLIGLSGLTALIIGLYLAKSALGINLMPGPSPLHGLYLLMR